MENTQIEILFNNLSSIDFRECNNWTERNYERFCHYICGANISRFIRWGWGLLYIFRVSNKYIYDVQNSFKNPTRICGQIQCIPNLMTTFNIVISIVGGYLTILFLILR